MTRYFFIAAIFAGLVVLPGAALRDHPGASAAQLAAFVATALLSVVPSFVATAAFWAGTRFGASAGSQRLAAAPWLARGVAVGLWLLFYVLVRTDDVVAMAMLFVCGGLAGGMILGIGSPHAGAVPRRWSVTLAYWACMLLLVLPMAYRATDAPAGFHIAPDVHSMLLLIDGGLASPYFLPERFPGCAATFLTGGGLALIARRLWIAGRSRSLYPPAAFRDAALLLAGIALGFWLFHALARLGVPGFRHYAMVVWFLAYADGFAAGFLIAWFWVTELRSLVALLRPIVEKSGSGA